MSHLTPILGETAVPLVLTFSENGVGGGTGLVIDLTLFRPLDGLFYDFNDNTFKNKASVVTLTQVLTEADATDLQGGYFFNWDSSTGVTTLDKILAYYEVTSAGKESVASDLIEFKADIESDISVVDGIVDAILVDTNEIQGKLPANFIMGSSVTTDKDDEIDAILVDTAAMQPTIATNLDTTVSSRASTAELVSEINDVQADIAALNDISPAEVNAEVDTALSDINLDHLLKVAVTGADVVDGTVIASMVSKLATPDWDSFDNTTDSLEAISDKSTSNIALIADAVWDELHAGHAITGSFGELMTIVQGLSQQNMFLDSTIHNSQGLLTAGRIRIFADNTFTASDGGSAEGEIHTFDIVAVAEAGTAGLVKTYQVKKQ